jgi:4-hydroxythreonine-4-phosphate dehydrogenase
MGEPGGVGAEIALKAWRRLRSEGPRFFLIDDPDRIRALGADVAAIGSPAEAVAAFAHAVPVLPLGARVTARAGVADPANAPHVLRSIDRAVACAISGAAAAVVTNPIQKSSLAAAGFQFPGHTEYLGALTAAAPMPAGRPRGPVMMIASPALRVTPLTIHAPLRAVPDLVTETLIVRAAFVVADALRHDFGVARPRIVVAGLNPHAGEAGVLGMEERNVIAPAVAALRRQAVADVRGPLPADTMFHEAARAEYDAAICMYHDQALIAVKTLSFFDAANVTLGLPIVRTSPDHGTALDIAGKDVADERSLAAALRLAAEIAARRERAA